MEKERIKAVYDSLQGLLTEEATVPGVEDQFAEGKPCALLYQMMLDAYHSLSMRLGCGAEDRDVETIISSLLGISEILGCEMYRLGAEESKRANR